jgi:hypothetical protein
MPLYTFLQNLPNVLVQIANSMGLQQKYKKQYSNQSGPMDYKRGARLPLQT